MNRRIPVALLLMVIAGMMCPGCKRTIRYQNLKVSLQRGCEDGYPGDIRIHGPDDGTLHLFEKTECTTLQGDLNLTGYQGSSLPDALQHLTSIQGSVHITRTNLKHLAFPELAAVGGGPGARSNIMIRQNKRLVSIGDFSSLQSVKGDINIQSNPVLTDIQGFTALQLLKGNLTIFDNATLTQTPAFEHLRTIGANLVISNPTLASIGPFSALESIDGNLDISDNPALPDIVDFPTLTTVNGELSMDRNPGLTALPAFEHLRSVGSLRIYDNTALPQCLASRFANRVSINGKVEMHDNTGDASRCR